MSEPTAGTMRAAEKILGTFSKPGDRNRAVQIINEETGLPELIEALELIEAESNQPWSIEGQLATVAIYHQRRILRLAKSALAKARGEGTT